MATSSRRRRRYRSALAAELAGAKASTAFEHAERLDAVTKEAEQLRADLEADLSEQVHAA